MGRQVKTPDPLIASLAGRQRGLVTRRQLREAGVGSEAIRHRLEQKRLHEQHRGVYSVGTGSVDRHGRWLAAVLACGDRAVLSHASAAELWGLLRPVAGPIHVTLPGTNRGRRADIAVHATRRLCRREWTRRLAIPVTTVERTLVDLAPDPRLDRALEQAFAMRLLGPSRMAEALASAAGRRGTRELRRLLARLLDDLPLTRSELERRFLRLAAEAGLPAPVVNQHHGGHRVDFAWLRLGLVVETDGRATHDNPHAFHEDRRRDLDLELADLHVVRLSWWQIVHEPERVVTLLRRKLNRAP
jgi:uncharacterized protein YjiS (DUF1127 family)